MKRILLLTLVGMITSFAFGQISITVDGNPHTSGTPYIITSAGAQEGLQAAITSTSSVNLTVERTISNPMPNWEDELCWGLLNGLGQCYSGIETSNPYMTPSSYTIGQQTLGDFQAKITPNDPDFGCSDYKYYILQNGSVILDSIEITVCKTASVEEVEAPLTVSVSPNPANGYFQVKSTSTNGARIEVTDVLGNVVMKETVTGSLKTINASNFRSGVYFVKVIAENQRPITRKVIIRH